MSQHGAQAAGLRNRIDACIIRALLLEAPYDSARMTETPPMSSLFISTID